jgi:Family of unknown function (DUF5690)
MRPANLRAMVSDVELAPGRVTRWLAGASTPAFMAWAIVSAFATYFCMYAFRKPFAVGTFAGATVLPFVGAVDTKIVLIVSQILGYACSKFLGIKVVSEMPAHRRAKAIVVAIAVAELALIAFGLVPAPYNAICLFFNGLPLGMVWGLVFGFLEGRRSSDGLGAGLCASFIVASGFVKTVGKLVMASGVTEVWMPAATGALFLLPMAGFVWMLAQLPPPNAEDIAERLERKPMDSEARRSFFMALWPGLVALVVAYVLLTAFRDFRDNFAREIWDALGYADEPSILTTAEIPVAVGSLAAVASCMVIRNNRTALVAIHVAMLIGSLLIGGATLGYQAGVLSPAVWMIAVGLGLYVGYVPYNCVLFDRLIPAVGHIGTAGFLIYVADASGYAGSVALLLYKNFGQAKLSWLDFFIVFSHATAWVGVVLFAGSALYFLRRCAPQP